MSAAAPGITLRKGLTIPGDRASEAIAILGRCGRGKTNTAGSFLYVPARVTHFDGADIDTILIGQTHRSGPWSPNYVSE